MLAAAAAGLEEEEEEETEEEKEEAEVGTAAGARPEARLQPGMLPLPSPSARAAPPPAPRENSPRNAGPGAAPRIRSQLGKESGPAVFARPPDGSGAASPRPGSLGPRGRRPLRLARAPASPPPVCPSALLSSPLSSPLYPLPSLPPAGLSSAWAAGPEGMGEGEGSPPPRPGPASEAGTSRALALRVSEVQAQPAVGDAESGAPREAARTPSPLGQAHGQTSSYWRPSQTKPCPAPIQGLLI